MIFQKIWIFFFITILISLKTKRIPVDGFFGSGKDQLLNYPAFLYQFLDLFIVVIESHLLLYMLMFGSVYVVDLRDFLLNLEKAWGFTMSWEQVFEVVFWFHPHRVRIQRQVAALFLFKTEISEVVFCDFFLSAKFYAGVNLAIAAHLNYGGS